MDSREMVTFGPVPSRRLGRSLGINNVSAKTCSYSCIYCQLGRTAKTEIERRDFFNPEETLKAVLKKVQEADRRG
jgi:wyosine [tRNA(Phe)-imidazoG37] synthetase (radical SAM superfamily)